MRKILASALLFCGSLLAQDYPINSYAPSRTSVEVVPMGRTYGFAYKIGWVNVTNKSHKIFVCDNNKDWIQIAHVTNNVTLNPYLLDYTANRNNGSPSKSKFRLQKIQ